MIPSNEERAVLAHVVVDPDAWVAHALATIGAAAVAAKIKRWRPDYLAAVERDGAEYKARAERDAP